MYSHLRQSLVSAEKTIGEWYYRYISQRNYIQQGEETVQQIQQITDRLNRIRKDYPPLQTVYIFSETKFAFIVPGHYIYISQAMMRGLWYEDQIAFILAHEMAHYDLGHTRLRSWTLKLLERMVLVLPSNWLGNFLFQFLVGLGCIKRVSNPELMADAFGLGLCLEAGYDGYKCASLFDDHDYRDLDAHDVFEYYNLIGWGKGLKSSVQKMAYSFKVSFQPHPPRKLRKQIIVEKLKARDAGIKDPTARSLEGLLRLISLNSKVTLDLRPDVHKTPEQRIILLKNGGT